MTDSSNAGPFTQRAREKIRALLSTGEVTTASVARALHMSTRTLQRRLDAESTNFRSLLDAERALLAHSHLEQGTRTVPELARMLGYDNERAFARALRRWRRAPASATRRKA